VTTAAPTLGPPGPDRRRLPALLRAWLWGWGGIAQLVLDLLLAGPYLVVFGLVVGGVSSLPAFGVGVLLLVPALLVAMPLAAFERLRVEAFTGVHVAPFTGPRAGGPRWRRLLLDARPWRASAHLTVMAFWGLLVGTVTTALVSVSLALVVLPLYDHALPGGRIHLPIGGDLPASPLATAVGVFGVVVLPLVARGLVGVDVAMARTLIGPPRHEQRVAELTQRVETLTHTREMTVDSVELERRRIERDLHDGPQQRLVALAMDLGMAQAKLDTDLEGARRLLDQAHAAAKEAIVEMRQVARGIHPPVLTDRGLDAALSALAARAPLPVAIRVQLPVRPSPTIESIAYFCVSEALTNIAKHAQARTASVDVTRGERGLTVVVADDGRGGADPSRGTGLSGLRQRLAAVDGTLTIDSPPDGGTRLTMTLPDRAAVDPMPTPPRPRSTP
jgi:signal transduction histidine kinase